MAFCRKCGKELAATESFCSACGTKVDGINFSDAVSSVKRGTAQLAEKVTQNVQGSEAKSNIAKSYEGLRTAKTMFWVTLGSVLLNFILMFSDMVKINLMITSKSGSFIKIMHELKDLVTGFGGSSSDLGDAAYLIPMLNVSIILTVAALVLTALPILLGKAYNRKSLILNYVSMIYNFLLYLIVILAYSAQSSGYSEIEIKFMAYVYLVETVAVIVITKMFSKKVKAVQRDEALNAVMPNYQEVQE